MDEIRQNGFGSDNGPQLDPEPTPEDERFPERFSGAGRPADAFRAARNPEDAYHAGYSSERFPVTSPQEEQDLSEVVFPEEEYSEPAIDVEEPFPQDWTSEQIPPDPTKGPLDVERFRWEDVEPRQDRDRQEKEKTGRPGVWLRIFAVIVSCALVLTLGALGFVLANLPHEAHQPSEQQEEIVPHETEPPVIPRDPENAPNLIIDETPDSGEADPIEPEGPLTTSQIAAKVKPSVVGVVTYTAESGLRPASEGSGIIMTEDGYIITNEHVIDSAAGIKVVLEDGSEYEAVVMGADLRSDLAVIRIDRDGLTAARFGDSSKLVAGEPVVAIGNPGGLKYAGTVTQGIVSATDRIITSATDSGYTINCIQTDAAINPGNSGGALVNSYGQVIGINSSKIVATGFEGIGFSIAINEAKPIIDDLIAYGYVRNRVKIGVTLTQIDEVLAKLYDIPEGFMVLSLEETSEALEKGLQPQDIITKIDSSSFSGYEELSSYLGSKKAGDAVELEVFRRVSNNAGRTFTITVHLQEDRGIQK